MGSALRSFWTEPRAPNPPARVWRDWILVAGFVAGGILEAIFREDLASPVFAAVVGVGPAVALLWRRTHPLAATLVGFGGQTLAYLASSAGADSSAVLGATAYVLLFPYALFRWGAGREAMIGMTFILVTHFISEWIDAGVGEAALGVPFLLLPAALGTAVRYRATSRLREADQAKLREREQLARELHDSVAHHVSAIAIRAQAGRTLAAARPQAAVEALEVIEEAASRTLDELRAIVGALRRAGEAELGPQPGIADIQRLAPSDGPRVDVELGGDLDHLRPLVETAIFRLAQESITNAIRHARHATRIEVRITGDEDCVRLTVRDDGDGGLGAVGAQGGYGLVGMAERATLLGGTLEAGPSADGGWTVSAFLPRNGTAR